MDRLLILLLVFSTIAFVLADVQWTGSRARRGVSMKYKSWTSPIPYTINDRYTADQRSKIKAAIASIMESSCIDFKEDNGSGNRLEYVNLKKCSSFLGDRFRDKEHNHDVSLDPDCLNLGKVQHETMHALGFEHTQNRPDRDEYLTVNWTNIDNLERNEKNFIKIASKDVFDYGIPYEMGSRMHYTAYFMGKNFLPVLIPKDKDYLYSMGTAKVLTFYDWRMLNMRYCNASCPGKNLCQNGGYPHPRDCSKCICSGFHEGKRCETERGLMNLDASGKPQVISFERTEAEFSGVNSMDLAAFEFPPVNVIRAPANRRIRVTIEKMGSWMDNGLATCEIWAVELADGDLALAGKKFCSEKHEKLSFVSKSNVIGHRIYSAKGKPFESRISFSVEPETEEPEDETEEPKEDSEELEYDDE